MWIGRLEAKERLMIHAWEREREDGGRLGCMWTVEAHVLKALVAMAAGQCPWVVAAGDRLGCGRTTAVCRCTHSPGGQEIVCGSA